MKSSDSMRIQFYETPTLSATVEWPFSYFRDSRKKKRGASLPYTADWKRLPRAPLFYPDLPNAGHGDFDRNLPLASQTQSHKLLSDVVRRPTVGTSASSTDHPFHPLVPSTLRLPELLHEPISTGTS